VSSSRTPERSEGAVGLEQPPPSSQADLLVGKTIDGRYVVERVLGEGGMGIVYAGRHRVIDKKIALKVLRGDMAKDKEVTERFLQEARAASSIGNPHIVDISDFGELPDGSTYFVMELLDGLSLTKVIDAQRPMPVPRLIHVAKQIAAGLSAAHQAGIVHRDLKPDNVMVIKRGADKDFVKILDFGIAKVGAKSKITRAGQVFGTPHYMSPEQAAGTSVDSRTDVYALGVILYEMASGKVPFDADNFMGILTQHMYKAPVPILAMVPPVESVPPGLDAIIQKCLSKKPEQRYATMDALVDDLTKVEQGGTPEALPEMMARSGGFHVPADYFSRAGMPAPVPASPSMMGHARPKSHMGLYVAIAATVAVVALGVMALVSKPSTTSATPTSIVMNATATPTPTTPATPSASASATASASAPATAPKQILLAVEPTDAKVTRDGNDLGGVPIALSLADGETATLVITRAGFKSQTITLDGTETRKLVKLVPAAAAPAKAKTSTAPAQQQGAGTSVDGFQDPFLKK
jgi:serine/threonine-protein kinase